MPINPSALGASDDDPAVRQPDEHLTHDAQGQPKRKRRTKPELIAAAVVPADDDQVELKDAGTGVKIQRTWLVALEMIRDGKAEFADKAMKYAMLKHDQQKVAGAFEQPKVEQGGPVSTETQVSKGVNVPPDAEVGDEVRVGAETFRVGHDGVLTTGPISVDGEVVQAKRRWQRELGSGLEGPWESSDAVRLENRGAPPKVDAEANGNGGAPVPVVLPENAEIEQVDVLKWKVGTGILQKIGLPDYSSLQIGPVSASRMVVDDGRRITVQLGDRTVQIPAAVVEAFQEVSDSVEYVSRYQRGELVSFLESTGALRQPVS